jgi:hypothetical protein
MSWLGYETFYVNGTSHSHGGGLEEPEISGNDSTYWYYKDLYNTDRWKSRSDVNFGKRLSDLIGIPCVNEAQSGGSCDRLVRMSYDWINDNWYRKDKIFLILENPDGTRAEVYYKPNKSYYIVNTMNNEDNTNTILAYATREYFNKQTEDEDRELQPVFKEYFDRHLSVRENWKNSELGFVGLYSFCKMNGIKVFVQNNNNLIFRDCFQKEDIIKFGNDEKNYDISSWAHNNNKTIKDETNRLSSDGHPGYYAHMEYAELLKTFIENRLKTK